MHAGSEVSAGQGVNRVYILTRRPEPITVDPLAPTSASGVVAEAPKM